MGDTESKWQEPKSWCNRQLDDPEVARATVKEAVRVIGHLEQRCAELEAWKQGVFDRALRLTTFDVAPTLCKDGELYVSADRYNEKANEAHVNAGAVQALIGEIREWRRAAKDSEVLRRLQFMRPEEALYFAWSFDKREVSVVRTWKNKPTYQLQGPVTHFEKILLDVLPHSEFRDETGYEL